MARVHTCHVGVDDGSAIPWEIHVFAGNAGEDLAGRRAKVDDIVSGDTNRDWSTSIWEAVKRYVRSVPQISRIIDTHISVIHAPLRSGTPNGMAWNALKVATTPG